LKFFHEALAISAGDEGGYVASIQIRLANLHREQAHFDSAEYYYTRAIINLDESKPSTPLGQLYQNRGNLDYTLSRHQSARKNFQKALDVRLQLGDSLSIGESWKSLGMVASALAEYDTAEFYYKKILRLSQTYKNPELLIFYNIYQGELHLRKGDFVAATKRFTEALDSLAKHDYKRYRAMVMKDIGQVFEWEGDYQRSLEFYYNALRIEDELTSNLEIARTKQLMGWVYVNQHDYRKAALMAFQAAVIFRNLKDDFGLSDYYTLSGYIAYRSNQFDQALKYYDSALVIRDRLGTLLPTAQVLNLIAELSIAQGEFDLAGIYAKRVYDIDKRLNNRVGIASYYNTMSAVMLAVKDHREAEAFAQQALLEATAIRSAPERRKAYQNLFSVYKQMGFHEKAVRYYDHYIQLNDSMYTRQSATRQAELDALYRLEKREQEIRDLHERTALQEATLNSQNAKIRFQNTANVFFILGLILLGSLAYVLYRYSRAKNAVNLELKTLNDEITLQKKEIQEQSAELQRANESLVQLNFELVEKTEEIEAQSEELRESNEMIVAMNHDLDSIVTKRTAQLKEAYKELDTFFYRSSHDFRRPLTTFMGLAEVAKVTIRDKAALDLFDKVKETAKSLDKMLVKLQSISDVGAQELVYKEVLVKEIFDGICHAFQEELEQKDFKVECDVQLNDSFVSYPAMVKVILENMVENAIQFSTVSHPWLKLTATQQPDTVTLEIEDNGQGIPTELKDRVFDMYFRGNERSKGNGLGLYIVKKAVQKLNGHIHLDARAGSGCHFIIVLPTNQPPAIGRMHG
jgi:signal transduction histidine kinase